MPIFYGGFNRGPRRGRGGSFFLIFFLIAFAPELLIYGGLYTLLPILMLGIGAYLIGKVVSTLVKNVGTSNSQTYSFKKESNTSSMSNAELVKIDKKLDEYFKENVSLPIIDDIALVTKNGKYKALDDLYITYKNEKIAKLDEFKQNDNEMYQKIKLLLLAFSKTNTSKIKEKVQKEEVKETTKESDAQKYIRIIDTLNAQIPQEEITNGLDQTCDLLNKIEKTKQSKVDKAKLTKLYDYYLPILTGILENYKNLQDAGNKNEEFKKSESQLIKTIMLINQALKTLYDDMHEDDYLNINADINTLQALLEKDGYGQDPFKK